jgi:hypothetical protein
LGLSTRSRPTCPAANLRYATSSCVWLYRSPVLCELWPIHCFCRSCGVPALRSCVTRECLNACSRAFGIPAVRATGRARPCGGCRGEGRPVRRRKSRPAFRSPIKIRSISVSISSMSTSRIAALAHKPTGTAQMGRS